MDRRSVLTHLGAGAAGLFAVNGVALAQPQQHAQHEAHVRMLDDCARECGAVAHHCLEQLRRGEGDKEFHARTHGMALACESFCQQTSALMERHNPLVHIAQVACADACRDCGQQCAKGKAEVMTRCAEICKKCEAMCRQAAKASTPAAPGQR